VASGRSELQQIPELVPPSQRGGGEAEVLAMLGLGSGSVTNQELNLGGAHLSPRRRLRLIFCPRVQTGVASACRRRGTGQHALGLAAVHRTRPGETGKILAQFTSKVSVRTDTAPSAGVGSGRLEAAWSRLEAAGAVGCPWGSHSSDRAARLPAGSDAAARAPASLRRAGPCRSIAAGRPLRPRPQRGSSCCGVAGVFRHALRAG